MTIIRILLTTAAAPTKLSGFHTCGPDGRQHSAGRRRRRCWRPGVGARRSRALQGRVNRDVRLRYMAVLQQRARFMLDTGGPSQHAQLMEPNYTTNAERPPFGPKTGLCLVLAKGVSRHGLAATRRRDLDVECHAALFSDYERFLCIMYVYRVACLFSGVGTNQKALTPYPIFGPQKKTSI